MAARFLATPLLLLLIHVAAADYAAPPLYETPPPHQHQQQQQQQHHHVEAVPVIEGMVYCQRCDAYGSWSLANAEPLDSAKVSVICKNHRDQVIFYKVLKTSSKGYFYSELEGYKLGHSLLDHPLHACKVKLLSSPRQDCDILSNINNGLYGAKLRYEGKRIKGSHYEAVIYAAGPLAFRPDRCPAATPYSSTPTPAANPTPTKDTYP